MSRPDELQRRDELGSDCQGPVLVTVQRIPAEEANAGWWRAHVDIPLATFNSLSNEQQLDALKQHTWVPHSVGAASSK